MAIKTTQTMTVGGKPLETIEIDNGDLQALKTVMEQYGFINEEALLRYALVSLLESSDNTLYIKKDGSNIVAVKIAPSLLKSLEGTVSENVGA